MYTKLTLRSLAQAALLLAVIYSQRSTAHAQGTAFTYQGRLNDNGSPANGVYDLQFGLWSAGGTPSVQLGGTLTNAATPVSNGLFTVTLEFGANFPGADRWLEIGVRTNGGGTFIILAPRQQLTATPYAIYAPNAGAATSAGSVAGSNIVGTITTGQLPGAVITNGASGVALTGSFTGNGAGLTNLSASNLTGSVADANLSANAALLNRSPQTFSGGNNSFSGSVGIGTNNPLTRLHLVGTGASDDGRLLVETTGGTFGPQLRLKKDGPGGDEWVFVADGSINGPVGALQVVQSSSGSSRLMIATNGNVGLGTTTPNSALQVNGTVTANAFAGNGVGLSNLSAFSLTGPITIQQNATSPNVILGFPGNYIAPGVAGSVIAGGGSASLTNSIGDGFSMVGSGEVNAIGSGSHHTFLGGGAQNTVFGVSDHSVIAGGEQNQVGSADHSFIGGGFQNTVHGQSFQSFIGGGSQNSVSGDHSFVGGGNQNTCSSASSSIVSGEDNSIQFGANDSFLGGGLGNSINNPSGASFSVLVGGESNQVKNFCATVPGGVNNVAGGRYSFAAGQQAQALHQGAFVWADSQNATFASTANDQFLIRAQGGVGIGTTTPAKPLDVTGNVAGVAAGASIDPSVLVRVSNAATDGNTSSPDFAGIGFGHNSTRQAIVGGTFGNDYLDFYTGGALTAPKMRIDFNGKVGIGILTPTNTLHVAGGVSATAFVNTSDRNAKENFKPVAPLEVLDKVAALPITTWNFKGMNDGRHMGPMAQDFYAAFGLGGSDTTITSVDPDGVALAAIQGLNQKVEEKDAKVKELEARLDRLEQLMNFKNGDAK